MKIADSVTIAGMPEQVWALIFEPDSLANLIPGCDRLEQLDADDYRGEMRIGIAAVSGRYDTHVVILEQERPRRCRMKGEVSGSTGAITGEATFKLEEVSEGTRLEYEGTAMISGALARVSDRFIEGVARALVEQALKRLGRELSRESEAVPGEKQ